MKKTQHILIGQKFNRLTVISHHSREKGYLCECECGSTTIARSTALKTGKHASCGCLQKELLAARMNKPNFEAFKNEIFKNYTRAAKKRHYSFDLTKEEFLKLISSNCYYCGVEPNSKWFGTKRTIVNSDTFRYNGVDRKNNSVGYVLDNCVPCCKICNNSKSTLTEEEWFNWIKRIYENQKLNINK